MQFLYVTASFLVEGAQIHEIGTISSHKRLPLRTRGAPAKNLIILPKALVQRLGTPPGLDNGALLRLVPPGRISKYATEVDCRDVMWIIVKVITPSMLIAQRTTCS